MGIAEWARQFRENAEERAYGDNPAKLAEIREKRARMDEALAKGPELPDLTLLTDEEIELLRRQTVDEIEAMERSHHRTTSAMNATASMAKPEGRSGVEAFAGLLSNLTGSVVDAAIRDKKLILHKIEIYQKNKTAPVLSPEDQAAQLVGEKVRRKSRTIARLEADCEEEVKRDPAREAVIRKQYRKAIDAILEED